jgi:hypothetical protein
MVDCWSPPVSLVAHLRGVLRSLLGWGMSFNGVFSRALTRHVGLFATVTLLTAGLSAVPAAAASRALVAPTSAKTAAEAGRLAQQFNTAVEVADQTTEYTRTVATPQGTLSTEVSNTPVRTRRGADWVSVDRNLEARGDGTIGPKAAIAEVSFSGGGGTSLAKFADDGRTFELKSPWALPQPTLDGSKATYAAVLPGVDLVLEATEQGFSYNVVVQTREAAANPALKSLTFPVSTTGLTLRAAQSGRVAYVDPGGREVLSLGEALMWDSSGRAAAKAKVSSASAAGDGPADDANRTLIPFDGSSAGLTLQPDQTMLNAADTVYPVVIDPTMIGTSNRNGWTAVWELYPSQSFWKTEHSLGVGYEGYEQSKIVRSFFQFDVAAFANKKILNASLRTYETHSASCTARRVIATRTGPVSAATTWSNQPGGLADVAYFDGAKGWSSSCPAGYVEFDVTSSIQYTSATNGRTATFRLRAATENDKLGWKQFDSTGLVTIEYVAYPLPGYALGSAAPTDPLSACSTSANPSIIASMTPEVSARGNIGPGDNQSRVRVQLQIVSPSGSIWTMTSAADVPFQPKRLKVSQPIGDQVTYHYHARTLLDYPGGQLVSAWSVDCYFRTDTTAPPAPTIKASYNGVSLDNCLTSSDPDHCPEKAYVGTQVTYTITSTTSDVVALSYVFASKTTKISGKTLTVNLDMTAAKLTILEANAHDSAGYPSPTARFEINVGPAEPPVGSWSFNDGTASDGSGQNHALTVAGAEFDPSGRVDGSLELNGVGDHATASVPVVDTSRNFSLSAWARLTSYEEGAVVGVYGSQSIAAQLYYSQSRNRWAFMQHVSDTGNVAQTAAVSVDPPVLGVWTHLVGVYEASTKKMTLYVNGRAQGSATFTYAPWKGTSPLEVGWYKVGANHGAAFTGSIDEVTAYARILTADEAEELSAPKRPFGDDIEPVVGPSAHYAFDGVAAGTDQVWRTADDVYGADLTVAGFGQDQTSAIVSDPTQGFVLATTGGNESVSINRPVVDAAGSFTVMAWVKLSDTSKPRVILRQAGTSKDSWRLEYRPTTGDGAVFAFVRASSDSAGAAVTEVTAATDVATAQDWVPLIATYDAANETIALADNELLESGGSTKFAPTPAPVRTGSTVVAAPAASGAMLPFAGRMDDLRMYAGVLSDRLVCTVLRSPEECS